MPCLAVTLLALLIRASWADALSGSLGVDSDDAFRGLSQNDGQASVQGDLHYSATQWYAGASAELVRRGVGAGRGAELIGYAAYQRSLGEDWSGALALRHYDYPGNARRSEYNYDELNLSLNWRQRLALNVSASPDTYAAAHDYRRYGRGAAYSYEVSAHQPLPHSVFATVGVGYYDLTREVGGGYVYTNAGLGAQWRSWEFDLRYVWTDAAARRLFGSTAERRLIASALWFF